MDGYSGLQGIGKINHAGFLCRPPVSDEKGGGLSSDIGETGSQTGLEIFFLYFTQRTIVVKPSVADSELRAYMYAYSQNIKQILAGGRLTNQSVI